MNPSNPFADVETVLPFLKNHTVQKQIQRLLQILRIEMTIEKLTNVPMLHLVETEKGACILEWHYKDQRFGFAAEVAEIDSGWFFVSSRESGRVFGYGRFSPTDLRNLLRKMFA